jgi:S-adenosylmethionine:tRNA ribosyltransferase-isomerase
MRKALDLHLENMTSLNINEYLYELPAERIARYPLQKRDDSKLLVWKKNKITHAGFRQLADFLPTNSFLFFNDTKVIPARLHFLKDTGAVIEIFLLHPIVPSSLLIEAMQATGSCTWNCTIGNLRRWSSGTVLTKTSTHGDLRAFLQDREKGIVRFTWSTDQSFAEIVSEAGETPLPPYLKREAEASDRERYQTIYSHHEGAVAAPTAGLHFTESVFESLRQKGIGHDFLTLHVSAGTFQPIKTENVNDHPMHKEQLVVSRKNVQNMLKTGRAITPVGTTSMRTLESLYWFGARLSNDKQSNFMIEQDEPYVSESSLSRAQALDHVLDYMDRNSLETLIGETSIFIKPGYKFRMCDALITNFHQPGSTLILLVAAFTGKGWRNIYDEALNNGYRFLSYGDSSLLMP